MKKAVIGTGHWVIVCDGRKALILENIGDAKFPNLRKREVFDHASKPTHVLGADRPGRSYQSAGRHRSAVEQTDLHDEAERSFLHMLAKHLNDAVKSGQTKVIVLVAPPRALGMIRHDRPSALQHAIIREITKDAVKLPIPEIEKLVFEAAPH